MKSIQSKLSTGLIISLTGILLIFWLVVSNSIQRLAENYISSRLQHDIETLVTATDFDSNNGIELNSERIDIIYQRPFSGHYYIIQSQHEQLRSRSLWDQSLQIPATEAGRYVRLQQSGPEQQLLLSVTGQFNKQGHAFQIIIAEDLTPVLDNIQQFKNRFALLSFAVLFLLLGIQIFILRRNLRPLQDIRHELSQLEQGRITSLDTEVPGELKPIIHEINHLLSAQNKRLKRSRDALGDLSHAIKKPLTILHQLQQQLSASLDAETSKTFSSQLDNIHQLTDRILKRARLAGNVQSGALFDFNSDLPALVKTIKAMYPQKQLTIDHQLPSDTVTHIDREDMMELLGNLLDNASKWARNSVLITVSQDECLHITIEDDGAGSTNESFAQLARRGVRLDEAIEGHGFGLAIVSDIIDDYAGKLSFDRSTALGGFRVDIKLPGRR